MIEIDPRKESIILELLIEEPSLILMFKDEYITENMWKISIENEPPLFQFMVNPSDEIIQFALEQDGANIKYLKNMGIQITPKMIYTAVKNYPGAIYLIPKSLRSNKLKEYACTEDPSLMREFSLNRKFIEARLKEDPTLVRYLPNPSEDQICKALEKDPSVCAYIKNFTPRMKSIIISKYPEIIPLISNDSFKNVILDE